MSETIRSFHHATALHGGIILRGHITEYGKVWRFYHTASDGRLYLILYAPHSAQVQLGEAATRDELPTELQRWYWSNDVKSHDHK